MNRIVLNCFKNLANVRAFKLQVISDIEPPIFTAFPLITKVDTILLQFNNAPIREYRTFNYQ